MKIRIYFVALMMMLSSAAISAKAAEKNLSKEQTEARVLAIKDRVETIKAMDLKHMNRVERSELKHELKDMNKELRQMGPTYIYISAGALILIIILLLILL